MRIDDFPSVAAAAIEYVNQGFVVVAIPAGTKGPNFKGWNERQRCITTPAAAAQLTGNVGIAHVYSRTCCLDVDDIEKARPWLAERGVDLDAILNDPLAVHIRSGRPGRDKVMFRLPEGWTPRTFKPAMSGLELRCASANGLTMQDVLPPSVHPDTGQVYWWDYDDLLTHWSDPPDMPAELERAWRALENEDRGTDNAGTAPRGLTVEQMREALGKLRPEALNEYDPWLKAGMAIHHETDGSEDGLDLWDEFSALAPSYTGREALEARWTGFGKAKGRIVTWSTIERMQDPVHDFDVIGEADGTPRDQCGRPIHPFALKFWAVLKQNVFIHEATGETFQPTGVDNAIPTSHWPHNPGPKGKPVPYRPTVWLARHRGVLQVGWRPGAPMIICGEVVVQGEWKPEADARVFNRYHPPPVLAGDPAKARPWLDLVKWLYPNTWLHIVQYFAFKLQKPEAKVNHALVLGGIEGIGKDSILTPIRAAFGGWNVREIAPKQVFERFNDWAQCVLLVVNEVHDIGEANRFTFHERTKTLLAAPPDVSRVEEKYLSAFYVSNVCGVIFTTNHQLGGLYLSPNDRRHHCSWSDRAVGDEFISGEYFAKLHNWYTAEGNGHVAAYLRALDVTEFDPKAPPVRTPWFESIVASGQDPLEGELLDLIEEVGSGSPPDVLSIADLRRVAQFDVGIVCPARDLLEKRNVKKLAHALKRCQYAMVPNPDAKSGLWVVPPDGRQRIYAKESLTEAERLTSVRKYIADREKK